MMIMIMKSGASEIAEQAFTRGGFLETGGWIAALLTRDLGLRRKGIG